MQNTDILMQEVFRRAENLRTRKLQRKKMLLGSGCVVLSLLLLYLLNGKTGMTVAVNTQSYGSLVFEGEGSHHVMIAIVFFLLGSLAGLGLDALRQWCRRRRIQRYTQRWIDPGMASNTKTPSPPANFSKP